MFFIKPNVIFLLLKLTLTNLNSMKFSISFGVKSAAICLLIMAPNLPTLANPNLTLKNNPLLKELKRDAQPVRQFKGEKPWGVWDLKPFENQNQVNTRGAVDQPTVMYENLGTFDFLEGPDGSTWFYTAEYEKDYFEVSEWYTEELIKAYTFTIYDSSFNEVGTISDKVTLLPGESKVAYAVLDPSLSQYFFNDDDNVEAMVYLVMNTGEEFGYEMHYSNKIYSLGGEKDADGYDVCIDTIPGRCADTFNAYNGKENIFYTFVEEVYPDPDDFGFNDYLDYINAAKTIVTVYHKNADGEPGVAFEKEIYLTRVPGDTTEGIYLITRNEKGVPYFIFSQYEKPYFVDPTGFAQDESATPDNSLVIETFTYTDGNLNEVSTTKIPVEIPKMDGQIAYYFYSIGSIAWKDDVDMQINGTPTAPAYVVARDYTTAANPDMVVSAYMLYDNSGKLIKVLSENADRIFLMNTAEGDQPHIMLVDVDTEAFIFSFMDLYSGEVKFSLLQYNNGDPLTASCQRVKGDNGKYEYLFEMQYDDVDIDGNDLKRIAWFDEEGKFERIDYINMGKDVMYATINTYPEALSPTLFDEDDAMEYAVLVKRMKGNTTVNEFLVVDDKGENYARFSEEDGKGAPMMFSIVPGAETNHLQMVYNDDYSYNIDIYNLPFLNPATIESIPSNLGQGDNPIVFDGENVMAQGCEIEIYNAAGLKVANGVHTIGVTSLPKGVYIIKTRDNKGKVSSKKLYF